MASHGAPDRIKYDLDAVVERAQRVLFRSLTAGMREADLLEMCRVQAQALLDQHSALAVCRQELSELKSQLNAFKSKGALTPEPLPQKVEVEAEPEWLTAEVWHWGSGKPGVKFDDLEVGDIFRLVKPNGERVTEKWLRVTREPQPIKHPFNPYIRGNMDLRAEELTEAEEWELGCR